MLSRFFRVRRGTTPCAGAKSRSCRSQMRAPPCPPLATSRAPWRRAAVHSTTYLFLGCLSLCVPPQLSHCRFPFGILMDMFKRHLAEFLPSSKTHNFCAITYCCVVHTWGGVRWGNNVQLHLHTHVMLCFCTCAARSSPGAAACGDAQRKGPTTLRRGRSHVLS